MLSGIALLFCGQRDTQASTRLVLSISPRVQSEVKFLFDSTQTFTLARLSGLL